MLNLLNSGESTYFYPLLAIVTTILFVNLVSGKYYKIWSPLTMVAITYLYYTILGPLISIYLNDTYLRLIDHRPYFIHAWKASLLSLSCIVLGYIIALPRYRDLLPVDKEPFDFKQNGTRIYLIGFVGVFFAFGVTSLTSINFFSGDTLEQSAITGGFRNYFLFMMNLFIPATTIMLVSKLKGKYPLMILIIAIFYAVALYITLGFRYRIILLLFSLLATYYLHKKVKPNYILLFTISIVVVTLMGFLGSARTYFSGLGKIEMVENKSLGEIFLSGFGEAQTFQSTGLVIEDVPYVTPHIGFKPVYESLAMPIPRVFWPSKPSGESLESIMDVYYYKTGMPRAGTGAAILNFGEYYLAFGWLGIGVASLALGFILRRTWQWFLPRRNDDLAIVFIAVFNSFVYVIISRGYLPQVVMNFFFTLGPLIWLIHRKKVKKQ
ncbi:MAG: O-antigen polysaccharide polymerase Wzy [Fulvivirga sp.]|nr:O-antigen polysaccharide polymerase Wzy [Fulvivirga sp.]